MTAQTYETDDEKEKKDIDFKRSWYIVKRLLQYVGKRDTKLLYPLAVFVAVNVIFSWLTPLIFRELIDVGLGGGIGATTGEIDVVIRLGVLFFFLTKIGRASCRERVCHRV